MDQATRLMTRKEAKEASQIKYYTGRECPKGHKDFRFTSNGTCCSCTILRKRANPPRRTESAIQRETRYRMRHKTRCKERSDAWRKAHSNQASAIAKKWRRNNPEAIRAHLANRRARVASAEGTYAVHDIKEMLVEQKQRCNGCGCSLLNGYHVDHKHPLSKGGSNKRSNLQLLCPPCNQSKGAMTMDHWKPRLRCK